MTTLIVGCGYVGSALAVRRVKRGERVIALTRSARALPEGVEPIVATLPDAALALPREIDRVVYAVAPDERTEAAYRRAYPDGVRSILAAVGPARFVLVSSTAVYAEDAGGAVEMTTAVHAHGPTTDPIFEAERMVTDVGGVVTRLSGIYGPGRDRIVRAVREGRTTGDASRVGNRIHRDDAAAAIDHLLDLATPAPIYDVTDSASVPMGEIFAWLAGQMNVTLPTAETTIGPRLTGKRLSNAPLLATGFALQYPSYREGYGALLAS